ncbi:HD-GYP domain-containing protein [Marinomonas pollencensis]|uniref:Hpt domain-containing protein n=1 Tax=Marinomonas pollencensis TaxID=491954 RepID=A0A3E0DNE7_9GAMM|nr:HD domain-containing phosphohydrolase [Marinomonas pollencensis]REG84243.1 Hpt domain-containing protein [Marinomonas pollencensis]
MGQFACKEFSALEKELKDDLLECYQDAQQEIENIINNIEDEGFSFEKLDNLFRSLHSMKGNCSVCFLDPLVAALHSLEEIVDGMRGGYIAYHYDLGSLINVVLEQVGELLQQLYQYHGAERLILAKLQSGLDGVYACENDQHRPRLARYLIEEIAIELSDAPIGAKTTSLLVKVQYNEAQQKDIDHFRQLSSKLNRLLGYSEERGERILKLCQLINLECQTQEDPAQLSAAAYMHNMGMAVVLNSQDEDAKQQAEFNHPMVGAKLLNKHQGWDAAVAMVEAHQERFDGSGTPNGLVGSLIPQGAFIVALAVMFIDVVWGKSGSEYRASSMRAIQQVNFESGKRFPPPLVDSFNAAIRKVIVARRQ